MTAPGRGDRLAQLTRAKGLTATALRVGMFLLTVGDENGVSFFGTRRIADELGIRRGAVDRGLAKLSEAGLVRTIGKRKTRGGYTSVRQICPSAPSGGMFQSAPPAGGTTHPEAPPEQGAQEHESAPSARGTLNESAPPGASKAPPQQGAKLHQEEYNPPVNGTGTSTRDSDAGAQRGPGCRPAGDFSLLKGGGGPRIGLRTFDGRWVDDVIRGGDGSRHPDLPPIINETPDVDPKLVDEAEAFCRSVGVRLKSFTLQPKLRAVLGSGRTVADLEAMWEHAERHGEEPVGLFVKWLGNPTIAGNVCLEAESETRRAEGLGPTVQDRLVQRRSMLDETEQPLYGEGGA